MIHAHTQVGGGLLVSPLSPRGRWRAPDRAKECSKLVRRYLVVGLLVLAAALTGVFAEVVLAVRGEDGRILPGVAIAGIPVAGMTSQEATARVQAAVDVRLRRPLNLRLTETSIQFTYEQLGVRAGSIREAIAAASTLGHAGPRWSYWVTRLLLARVPVNIPVPYRHDEAVLNNVLTGLANGLPARPQDAEVAVRNGAVVVVRPSQIGRVLDVAATRARIHEALAADAGALDAVVHTYAPKFATEDAEAIGGPLATFSTQVAPIPHRTHNIALAAASIRGRVLAPGEMFSYNRAIGPTTSQRGFLEAPVLINDELVPGEGGGVCQVSSTLFNVALLANLEILTRANHSRPVPYIPIGRDATVNTGALDLRFRNTSGHHLLLWASLEGQALTITAYGSPVVGQEVSLLITDREELAPPEGTVTKPDPELEAGQVVTREPKAGYRVKTYRLITVNGQLVRKEFIGTSFYRPMPRAIKVGTKKSERT